MRLHRFIGDFNLSQKVIEIKDIELINQVSKVLRLKQDDQFILSDGKENEAVIEIAEINKNLIKAGIIKKYKNENEPKNKVILYCAILKRENFELVVQKATETGIFEIVPIITERTVKTGLNMERLQKIIREAAEQSGRGIVPALHEPLKFEEAVKNGGILFDASGKSPKAESSQSNTNIFIGPEGGFSDNEVNLAKAQGLQIASLGSLTLRAETAVIVASYLTVNK